MHGLINRSIQCFLRDTYGAAVWAQVADRAGLGFDSFETMLCYEADLTERVINAAAALLGRPRETVLEDLGTYLVSHANLEPLRRLLRFGGAGFVDFLQSLEDLPERARLALPDLDLPQLGVADRGDGNFLISVSGLFSGVGHVVMGLMRAMADDYGALVVLDHLGSGGGRERVAVRLLDQSFSAGKRFDLAGVAV